MARSTRAGAVAGAWAASAARTLLVVLRPVRLRRVWMALVERANHSPVRIPWLQNKRLLFSLEGKQSSPSPEVLSATASGDLGVPC